MKFDVSFSRVIYEMDNAWTRADGYPTRTTTYHNLNADRAVEHIKQALKNENPSRDFSITVKE